jgi:putative pyruvate formate lyase activating enzyme
MEQYHPDAHVGKKKRESSRQNSLQEDVRYADINRAVTNHEVGAITKAARDAGLWRFAEAAKHGGFNL